MKTRVVVLVCVFGLFGYGCYRKGRADSVAKAAGMSQFYGFAELFFFNIVAKGRSLTRI